MLSVATWRRSGQFLIDFGRELYIPWQLSQGAVLYRDVDSLMGPGAAYVNAAVFWLVGPSVSALLLTNLAVLLLLVTALTLYFRDAVEPWVLSLALVGTLVVGTLSQIAGQGIYSFLTPYSHEATHGTLYAVCALFGVVRFQATGRLRFVAIAGVGLGATFLTKPEIFVATSVACAMSPAMLRLRKDRKGQTPSLRRSMALLLAFGLVVPGMAFLLFRAAMPAEAALSSTAGAWRYLRSIDVTDSAYYLMVSGLDAPVRNLMIMLGLAGVVLSVLASAYLVGKGGEAFIERRRLGRLLVALACLALLVPALAMPVAAWLSLPRALPVLTLAGGIYVLLMGLRDPDESRFLRRWLPFTVWAAFAFVLMFKSLLAVRLYQHGFYLALPAVLFVFLLGLDVLPARLEARGRGGTAFVVRSVALTLLAAPIAFHAAISVASISGRTYPVGTGADRILHQPPSISPYGVALDSTLRLADRVLPESASLAVYPEGAGVNYLLRRPNPTSHISLVPPELAAFGEPAVLEDLQRSPPDFILTWPRSLADYGLGRFGQDLDYAPDIVAWIDRAYRPVASVPIGDVPDATRWGTGFVLHRRLD